MGLDFPASGTALWALYDKTGVRPEWLLPVLSSESGLNPGVSNAAGAPYYGLNQIGGSQLQAMGLSVNDYLTWPASRQIAQVVTAYMSAAVAHYGPLRSGIRVYQANFYPASLKYAPGLDDTIVASPNIAYTSNTGLDFDKNGTITPRDLGVAVGKQAAKVGVKQALVETYRLRPLEVMTDPVLGEDFASPSWTVASLVDPRGLLRPSHWVAALLVVGAAMAANTIIGGD